jgi:hypothetical protein
MEYTADVVSAFSNQTLLQSYGFKRFQAAVQQTVMEDRNGASIDIS